MKLKDFLTYSAFILSVINTLFQFRHFKFEKPKVLVSLPKRYRSFYLTSQELTDQKYYTWETDKEIYGVLVSLKIENVRNYPVTIDDIFLLNNQFKKYRQDEYDNGPQVSISLPGNITRHYSQPSKFKFPVEIKPNSSIDGYVFARMTTKIYRFFPFIIIRLQGARVRNIKFVKLHNYSELLKSLEHD